MGDAYAQGDLITSDYFERDPAGAKIGISIQHLRKVRIALFVLETIFLPHFYV